MDISTSLTELKRVGTVTASNLRRLDLQTVADLLYYFPFRYDDLRETVKIADLEVGQTVTVTGQLELIQNKRSPRRRMNITEALISDGTEMLRVIWFNQPFLTRSLRVGDHLSLAGRVTEDFTGLVMTSPVYEKVSGGKAIHTQGIIPMYHLTSSISQKQLRSAIAQIVVLADSVVDWVPNYIIQKYRLESLSLAIRNIHFPKSVEDLKSAKDRLGFNELFLLQLRAQKQRQEFLSLIAPEIIFNEKATKTFVKSLPFDLTTDQKKSAWEIMGEILRRIERTGLKVVAVKFLVPKEELEDIFHSLGFTTEFGPEVEKVKELLAREPRPFPTVTLDPSITDMLDSVGCSTV